VADQAVFANSFGLIEITDDQPALQRIIEGGCSDLRRREFPMLGRSAIDAFDVQIVVFIESEFESVR